MLAVLAELAPWEGGTGAVALVPRWAALSALAAPGKVMLA